MSVLKVSCATATKYTKMPVNSYTITFRDALKYPRGNSIEDEKRVLRDMHTRDRGYGKRVLKPVDIFVSDKIDECETYKLFDGATLGPSGVQSRVVPGMPATRTFPALDWQPPETTTLSTSDQRSKIPSGTTKPVKTSEEDELAVDILCSMRSSGGSTLENTKDKHTTMTVNSYTTTFHDVLRYRRGNSIEDEERVLRDMHTRDRGHGKRVLKRVDVFVSDKLDECETYKLFDGATLGPSGVQSRVVPGMPATRTFHALDWRKPETTMLSPSDQRSTLPSGTTKPVTISEEYELAVDVLCSMRSSDEYALENAKRKHGSM